jgi:hypothetical protein
MGGLFGMKFMFRFGSDFLIPATISWLASREPVPPDGWPVTCYDWSFELRPENASLFSEFDVFLLESARVGFFMRRRVCPGLPTSALL